MTPADRLDRYQRATVEGIAGDLANAAPGGRNAAANVAAFQLGTLGRHGLITEAAALELVTATCAQLGLDRREALGTFRSGWRKGYAQGRSLPGDIESILRTGDVATGYRPPTPRHEAPAEPAPTYPPQGEVLALWAACDTAADDLETCEWLKSRAISADSVSRLDLARALLPGAMPAWATLESGRTLHETGNRLLVPLYDAAGSLRSLIFRNVLGGDFKSSAAVGYQRRGLVMANDPARAILAGRATESARIVICEGEPDWLTAAVHEEARPVFGTYSGSWPAELAAKIPGGSSVLIATHIDEAGERYAKKICESFGERWRTGAVTLERWTPK